MLIGATKSNSELSRCDLFLSRGFKHLPKLGCAYTKEPTLTSYNNARDEICPYCDGEGFLSFMGMVNPREMCCICDGTGKLSPVA